MTKIKKIVRLEETTLRLGGIGDNWHLTWANNDKQYVGLCDGSGWEGMPQAAYNSRMYAISGGPPRPVFEFLDDYPDLINGATARECFRYYNFGILALHGTLYQFLSTPNRPFTEENPRIIGAKLIYSPDNGKTWCNQDGSSPVRWEAWDDRSKDSMVFFEEPGDAFSLLTVLQMGKDYCHNSDGYIYVYAPNGNTEGTMNQLVMFRVRKEHLLNRRAYEFFAGFSSGENAQWSDRIEDRAVVHAFPSGWVNRFIHPYAWHPSVAYIAPLDLYLMANWGMGCGPTGDWFAKPSYLGFWSAKDPWGSWTQVHEETSWIPVGDRGARAYQPQIAPKWIAADGRSFWLVWTDFQDVEGKGKPYYSFNTQKVLIVAD
ncbi:hypothetical protein JXJ21_02575 [candidate division KSB1 bacterium]|nr:hypothetical protein [candidate division KSB1 bacterium]